MKKWITWQHYKYYHWKNDFFFPCTVKGNRLSSYRLIFLFSSSCFILLWNKDTAQQTIGHQSRGTWWDAASARSSFLLQAAGWQREKQKQLQVRQVSGRRCMAEVAGGLKITISGEGGVSGIPSTNMKSPLLTSDTTLIVSPTKSVGYFPGRGRGGADSHHDGEFVSPLMNLWSQSAIVSMCLSKKSLQCVWMQQQRFLANCSVTPKASCCSFWDPERWGCCLSMGTASHGLLNSLTFFCVSGSWFRASGPSQPPTERSHNNKWRAGETECSSVSSAESAVVFTAKQNSLSVALSRLPWGQFNQSDKTCDFYYPVCSFKINSSQRLWASCSIYFKSSLHCNPNLHNPEHWSVSIGGSSSRVWGQHARPANTRGWLSLVSRQNKYSFKREDCSAALLSSFNSVDNSRVKTEDQH